MKLLLSQIPIFVAHWSRLEERRTRLEKELCRLRLNATWLTCHDPEELAPEGAHGSSLRNDREWRRKTEFYVDTPPRALKRSEISLGLKHIEFYRSVRTEAYPVALVLEDDVLLGADFRDRFDHYFSDAPDDFDFVFIGSGCNLRITNPLPGETFYRKGTPATKCTDSYLITYRTAERLLRAIPPLTLPIDFELNYQIHAQSMKVYWLEPPLVVQGSQNGTYRSSIQ